MPYLIERKTIFSPDRKYRYALWREWDMFNSDYALFIGLNPSTADETNDDPTIRRCIGFAKAWGCGALCMVNIFAFRATDPFDMMDCGDPVGPENDKHLFELSQKAAIRIAAWGVHGKHLGRGETIKTMLPFLHCLGLTKDGFPKHPLYLPKEQRAEPYNYRFGEWLIISKIYNKATRFFERLNSGEIKF